MKLLNYYGDVVGDYICICAYMLLVNFLTCYWRRFDGVSMYWNMLVLIWWRLCEHMHCSW